MSRVMKWVFTVNTDAAAFAARLPILYGNEATMLRYICGQLEVAPETGNLHFQGYLQLKKSQRISWLKSHIHPTAHFEKQKAPTNDQARVYCMKDETRAAGQEFIECGEYVKGKGQRTDLRQLRDAIKTGMSHRQLIEEFTNDYARHTRFADRCMHLYRPPANENGVHIKLYFGAPGSGKTRKAYADHPDLYCSPISNGALWLDGYDRQPDVLLDDFSGALSKWSLTETLRLLDRYPVMVPVKGSFTWWVPETIIVTTNIHPNLWYKWKNRENQYHALVRRFHEVWLFPHEGEPEEQVLEDFFYDEELIWPSGEDLRRPVPTAPGWVIEQNEHNN